MTQPSHLIVGRVIRPHGIRGEVVVHVRTDEPDARFTVGTELATSRNPNGPGPDIAGPDVAGPGRAGAGSAVAGPYGPGRRGDRPTGGRGGAGSGGTGRPEGDPQQDDGVADDRVPGEARWIVPPTLKIEAVRAHQHRLIIAFAGVHDRNVADELRGVVLWVDASRLTPPDDPDEFHDHQLVGLTAVTPAGETLGEVARIDHAPAADLLVLRRTAGGTALVPFVKAIVPEVDLPGGRVVIDPPDGLFDL